ncbi:GTP cyclohydrolase II [Kangiella aquimarina]|uniref:GTP cyclohydrolase-2 n=1 Tax=Kangiella aquimarina TaxID=261965 RepID=A0ABZ0X4A1_9GAMM|nr:GTP cyclohydrolase II [Kangiella aquimarina]WQG85330.1 GTP cyclohydrolase II [Kangiella aquimarina]
MTHKDSLSARLPTPWGDFTIHALEAEDGKEHVALTFGEWETKQPVLARIHSECLTGDALFSLRCDCGFQLKAALQKIAEEGAGVLLYLRQEGRGIGLTNKIRAYSLQDQGMDTVQANEHLGFGADERDFKVASDALDKLGIQKIRLMTNNPRKVSSMIDAGIDVVERVPLKYGHNPHNEDYLSTKQSKLGHLF